MKFLKCLFLLYIIIGSIFFLVSIAYFNEVLLILSLSILMCGGVGFYILDKGQIVPSRLKRKNRLFFYDHKKRFQ